MKKLLIGCGVVVIVLALAGIGVSYWLYRKVSTTIGEVAELSKAPEMERQIKNTAPFAPPESGELTTAQVDRLVKVQAQVRSKLGQRFGEMQQKYKSLSEKRDATAFDLPQIVAAYRDLAATWMEAKAVQVDALNAASFSLAEYRWVRNQAYAALGLPIMEFDVARIVDAIKSGTDPRPNEQNPGNVGGSIGPSGPEENRKLIEPFKKQLEDNAALAAFGL